MTVARTKKEQLPSLGLAQVRLSLRGRPPRRSMRIAPRASTPSGVSLSSTSPGSGRRWTSASTCPRSSCPACFAPKDSGRLAVVIALRCDDTRLRRGVRVAAPAGGRRRRVPAATWTEPSCRGRPSWARSSSAQSAAQAGLAGFAAAAGARLAETRPWELRVDRRRQPQPGVYLDVRYRNFNEDETIPKEHKENLYRLEINEHPILWLNSAHPGVTGILNSKGHVGKRAILRDVVYDLIVPVVWIRLFSHAADQLRRGEEAAYSWQDSVLDAAARLLVPTRKDTEDARERLEAELEDFPGLLERLDAALQAEHELAKHVVRLAEELE